MKKKKLRISHVIIQPVLLWDDGDNLTPGPQAQPFSVALTDLGSLAEKLRAEVAVSEAQALAAEPGSQIDSQA